jgi:hypothetical protein
MDGELFGRFLPKDTTCQLCHKKVWIVSLPMRASLESDCGRADCPINADCSAAGDESGGIPLLAYQVSFAHSDNESERANREAYE